MQEDSSFGSSTVSFCPSFSSYTSPRLVDIADKVTQERDNNGDAGNIEEEDFEFVSLGVGEGDACHLFVDGQIRQVFPMFNRDLMLNNDDGVDDNGEGSEVENLLVPLRNLFMEDQEDGPPSSSSSSDADELEGLPEETYCVWVPNKNPESSSSSSNKCKKSNSTGSSSSSSSSSSKGWFKFRDLLKRSNSDGKESFIFLQKPKINAESKSNQGSGKSKVKAAGKVKVVSAHEAFYVKNRAVKQGDKKKSYLPYRQDLVGIFASNYVSSLTLGKTFPPF